MKTSIQNNSDRNDTGRAHPAPLCRRQTEIPLAIFLCYPDCSLKQRQLSTKTPWILPAKSKQEWSIKDTHTPRSEIIQWALQEGQERVAVDMSGGRKETDRQTDILQIPRLLFSPPSLSNFYSHHDFSSNISPGFYGAFVFFFPSLPVCSPHVCVYWFGLWTLGSFIIHIYLKASIFLPCHHQGCNITPKREESAQHPLFLPSPSAPCATLILIWAKHKSRE